MNTNANTNTNKNIGREIKNAQLKKINKENSSSYVGALEEGVVSLWMMMAMLLMEE
jgi:hypothetical protein